MYLDAIILGNAESFISGDAQYFLDYLSCRVDALDQNRLTQGCLEIFEPTRKYKNVVTGLNTISEIIEAYTDDRGGHIGLAVIEAMIYYNIAPENARKQTTRNPFNEFIRSDAFLKKVMLSSNDIKHLDFRALVANTNLRQLTFLFDHIVHPDYSRDEKALFWRQMIDSIMGPINFNTAEIEAHEAYYSRMTLNRNSWAKDMIFVDHPDLFQTLYESFLPTSRIFEECPTLDIFLECVYSYSCFRKSGCDLENDKGEIIVSRDDLPDLLGDFVKFLSEHQEKFLNNNQDLYCMLLNIAGQAYGSVGSTRDTQTTKDTQAIELLRNLAADAQEKLYSKGDQNSAVLAFKMTIGLAATVQEDQLLETLIHESLASLRKWDQEVYAGMDRQILNKIISAPLSAIGDLINDKEFPQTKKLLTSLYIQHEIIQATDLSVERLCELLDAEGFSFARLYHFNESEINDIRTAAAQVIPSVLYNHQGCGINVANLMDILGVARCDDPTSLTFRFNATSNDIQIAFIVSDQARKLCTIGFLKGGELEIKQFTPSTTLGPSLTMNNVTHETVQDVCSAISKGFLSGRFSAISSEDTASTGIGRDLNQLVFRSGSEGAIGEYATTYTRRVGDAVCKYQHAGEAFQSWLVKNRPNQYAYC